MHRYTYTCTHLHSDAHTCIHKCTHTHAHSVFPSILIITFKLPFYLFANLAFRLQVLHLGGNCLESVPDELGELQQLGALVLCDNRLCDLPRAISNLTRLRSLLLHKNNLCCLPVGAVKLRSLTEVRVTFCGAGKFYFDFLWFYFYVIIL